MAETLLYKFVFILALVISVLRKAVATSSFEEHSISKDGDIMLGVLLPLHRKNSNGECTLMNKESLLWIKALNFALDEFKTSKTLLLRNVTFGLHLRDTCSKPALEHSLDILLKNKQNKSIKSPSNRVIGVLASNNDADASTLLSLFRIPQIIFSEQIKGKPGIFPNEHPYNFETVKVSYYRAKALIGLIKYFGWKSVSLVVNRPYYRDYLIFKHLAAMENFCFANAVENVTIGEESISAYHNLLNQLGHGMGVRVVVLFTDDMELLRVIRAIQTSKPWHFTWVEAMGSAKSVTQELSRTGETILTLLPEYLFLEKIKNYVSSGCFGNQPKKGSAAPSKQINLCDIESSSYGVLDETLEYLAVEKIWDPRTRIALNRAKNIQGVVNGALMVGQAVANYMEENCLDKTKEECFGEFSSHDLAKKLQLLIQMFFQGSARPEDSKKHFLKENLFSLVSIRGNSSDRSSRVVGTWDESWYINRAGIHWPGKQSKIPESTCSPVCPLGHVQVAEQGRKCCWSCKPCNYNQYITDNYTCADCVRGYWPSENFRTCEFNLQLTLLSCSVAISSVVAVLYSLVL